MQNRIFLIPLILLLPLVFFSCSDSPTSIGKDLFTQDEINVLALNTTTDSVYQKSSYYKIVLSAANSNRLLLGKHANAESSILIRFFFTFTDSIRQDILNNSLNVSSAFIEFVNDYQFGDSSAALDYQGFKVTSNWTNHFDADSLTSLNYDPVDIIQNTEINDSLYRIYISNQLASDWLLMNADTSTPPDQGLYIQPVSNSDKVLGFYAVSITNIKVIPLLKIVINKTGSFSNDTLTYVPGADLSVISGTLPDVGSEDIAVQGGLVVHSKLFFDLTKIPLNAKINSAILSLYEDDSRSIGSIAPALNIFTLTDSVNNSYDSTLADHLTLNGNLYSGNIANYVERWVKRYNKGMMITVSGELSVLDLTAFFGSNAADSSKRPQLKVVYTYKK